MTYKYDIGVYIVPKHIFDGQDWTNFKPFDIAKGWPVTTGPWKVVAASPEQKVFDRRDELVGGRGRTGAACRKMERMIYAADQRASSRAPRR